MGALIGDLADDCKCSLLEWRVLKKKGNKVYLLRDPTGGERPSVKCALGPFGTRAASCAADKANIVRLSREPTPVG